MSAPPPTPLSAVPRIAAPSSTRRRVPRQLLMPSQLTAACPACACRRVAHACGPSPCAATCSVMLVGWGGNNGTTVTGGILANKQ